MSLTVTQFAGVLNRIADRISERKEYLCELDRHIGDGDHGVSMDIGWSAIRQKLRELESERDLGALLQAVSLAFLNAVGASVGPLYGTAFLRGSAVAKGKSELSDEELAEFWIAAIGGIRQRGKAEPGDKTMIDAWAPIASSLEASLADDEPWDSAWDKAVRAGERGMNATKDLVSRKGRSGRLGDRSVGHVDPGAASAWLIFSTFVQAHQEAQTQS
ncbi:dihydroxyacetone kinase subunit DhaL [Cohnella caldifontis]|uniref:dihydroxyacetone kinase subunit DhaL n=1 Tax=Cohnella caldifontis TaxID=3027471 RepID=UPI0023ED79E7|nr:dihydroxyacetone kinase subunit DhaL [Cohnella sp. YIM B05605]